jgi:hypothetical protein
MTDAGVELGDRAAVFQTGENDSASFGACMVGNVGAGALSVFFVAGVIGMRVI